MRTIMHNPFGNKYPNAVCMENGICSKKFPKTLVDKTRINRCGYPLYPHRAGNEHIIGNKTGDNSSVVPYNKYLSKRYNCQINVESCQSLNSIKYIFKYIYKGNALYISNNRTNPLIFSTYFFNNLYIKDMIVHQCKLILLMMNIYTMKYNSLKNCATFQVLKLYGD